ncbi:MAG TPA: thiopurine S-methyltransferase [Oligoflexia bacterium]|nr:thiopurine S-methyltransferase [Oligoflexia bacterium]HMR25166.1 thiopurine S-methyltransferase [Oligoflexia bacterium]
MVKQDLTLWHQRWANNNIGFHQKNINQNLQDYVKQHQQKLGQHVLVPLCGKSLDMLWLKQQGFKVTGIEVSEQAIKAFFMENNLAYELTSINGGQSYHTDKIQILKKSFFELDQKDFMNQIDWIYDRAALIALDENLRKVYAKQLLKITPQAKHMLCICMEKLNDEKSGPPFSVKEQEIKDLYQNFWNKLKVERFKKKDAPDTSVYFFYRH